MRKNENNMNKRGSQRLSLLIVKLTSSLMERLNKKQRRNETIYEFRRQYDKTDISGPRSNGTVWRIRTDGTYNARSRINVNVKMTE